MIHTTLEAEIKNDKGRGASRRLRRNGLVPAIIYGLDLAPIAVHLDHNIIYHSLKHEDFYTSILSLNLSNGTTEKVLLRDVQFHSYKQQVLHLDFQRISDKDEINMHIPLHFINEDKCPAVTMQGAKITHIVTEVEVRVLVTAIPHFIEVDLKDMKAGQSVHLSDLVLPAGVSLVNLIRGEDSVVSIAASVSEDKEATATTATTAD